MEHDEPDQFLKHWCFRASCFLCSLTEYTEHYLLWIPMYSNFFVAAPKITATPQWFRIVTTSVCELVYSSHWPYHNSNGRLIIIKIFLKIAISLSSHPALNNCSTTSDLRYVPSVHSISAKQAIVSDDTVTQVCCSSRCAAPPPVTICPRTAPTLVAKWVWSISIHLLWTLSK